MNYFDRFLSRLSDDRPPESKEEFQLIALSCFYLAVKLFQAGPVLSTHHMAKLSGDTFSAQQVAAMEMRILSTLRWCLHPCCAADFVRPFFIVVMRDVGFPPAFSHYDILEHALGSLHTGTLDYFFTANKLLPSHMAAAALLNAMHAILPATFAIPSVMDLIKRIQDDTGFLLNEGQINLCRQRFWSILVITGLEQPSPADFHALRFVRSNYQTHDRVSSPQHGYEVDSSPKESPVGVSSECIGTSQNESSLFLKLGLGVPSIYH